MEKWLIFVVGAALMWGAYGPALHTGQTAFGDKETRALRALLCVGGAYFLVGVLVPLAVLASKGQLAGFTGKGVLFSTASGILGAGGAVCIIWAFRNQGSPLVVMPLVFAGAPVVNSVISTISHPPKDGLAAVNPLMWVGLAMAAAGAYLVLAFKPS